jgi:Methyltransferase domain
MFEPNVERVLSRLAPADVVLDVGGWACPFNRANIVLDAEPFETRGYYRTIGLPASQGGPNEQFTRESWIQRDICAREPWPLADKSIDFAICSHTLEDLRDPLWVCSELVRVAKAGYIEVPSRAAEQSRGWEHPRIAGLSHHRWLIDIEGGRISFLMKFHLLHADWRCSLPASFLRELPGASQVQWLFWEGSFAFDERVIHGSDAQAAELRRFVREVHPYSPVLLGAAGASDRVARLAGRAWRKAQRLLRTAGGKDKG